MTARGSSAPTATDRRVAAALGYRPRRTGEQCNGCGSFCGRYVRADRVTGDGVICAGCDREGEQ